MLLAMERLSCVSLRNGSILKTGNVEFIYADVYQVTLQAPGHLWIKSFVWF